MDEDRTSDGVNAPAGYPLEAAGPLSRSVLWNLQRRYFERAGVGAWSEGTVPSYVTSNPFIASAYAAVVAAYLGDGGAGLDPAQPVYIIELAAGAGRFAYHFLRRLVGDPAGPRTSAPPITYIMTDYNEALLDFWETHPALQPYVAAGRLDFARFDAAQPGDLRLRRGGKVLAPALMRNPLVLVANYFFDSIPQDAFYVENGQLYESLAQVQAMRPGVDADAPDILDHVQLVYRRQPVDLPYYGAPELDELLEEYRTQLRGSALAFPNVALRCLNYFRGLSGGRLLLLTTDKGYHRPDDLQGRHEPGFQVHGSFSITVNYHALGRYFERRGGLALRSPDHHPYLDTGAFLLGAPPGGYEQVGRAYAGHIGDFGPEDFFLVQRALGPIGDSLKAEEALALLRLSRWDARIFQACFAGLLNALPEASAAIRADLRAAVNRVWANYYHIGEEYDLPYDLAVLLYKLGEYEAALAYFGHSLALYGDSAKTRFNMALCHYGRHDLAAALRAAVQATLLDPSFEQAAAFQRKLLRESAVR